MKGRMAAYTILVAWLTGVSYFAGDVIWEGDILRNLAGQWQYHLICERGDYPQTESDRKACSEGLLP